MQALRDYSQLQMSHINLHSLTSLHALQRRSFNNNLSTTLENDSGSQTSNLLLVLGDHIGKHSVLSRWDLVREVNVLGQSLSALLERALEVDVLDGIAEIGGLTDDSDETVLDLQVDLCALGDVLLELAARSNRERLAAGTS